MANYMEENLDMPLAKVLPVIQGRITSKTTYHGIPTLKSPLDFWVYQEIIFETKPDIIIEIGNNCGGSTLALAHMCDLMGHGRVIGLDISHGKVPDHVRKHPRITLIEGDACQSFESVRTLISKEDRILVIEDSAHTFDNTLKVLRTYSVLTKAGDYFIVEDSICHHGLSVGPNPGPYEAIEAFINENSDFEIDRSRESFLITWNPKGYLRRRSLSDENAHKNT
jgi:cephalosporin hydroxylase